MKKLVVIGLAAAGLSGCAIDLSSTSRAGEFDKLAENCRERGGILVPLRRDVPAGNESANWACEISGGATRIDRK